MNGIENFLLRRGEKDTREKSEERGRERGREEDGAAKGKPAARNSPLQCREMERKREMTRVAGEESRGILRQ